MSARLLEKLQELHTNGPAPHNYGICTQTLDYQRKPLHVQQWPGRSGSINYPVPASRTDTSPKAAQLKYAKSRCGTATLSKVSCVGNY